MTAIEEKIYTIISETPGLKSKQIAYQIKMDKSEMNSLIARSKELKELVVQGPDWCWYPIIGKTAASIQKKMTKAVPEAKTVNKAVNKEPQKDTGKNPEESTSHKAYKEISYPKGKERPLRKISNMKCGLCGKPLVERVGRYGRYYACSEYPICRYSFTPEEPIPGKCPVCGRNLVEGATKKGYAFYRCEAGRECGFITWHIPTDEKCEKCGKTLFWPKKTNVRICLNKACPDYGDVENPNATKPDEQKENDRKPTANPAEKLTEKKTIRSTEPEKSANKTSPGKYYNNI